jgi:hypothetical protein
LTLPQVESVLVARPDAPPAVAMSATRSVEPGARVTMLLAEDLFRLDVVVEPDTLRTVVRNLSAGELRMLTSGARSTDHSLALGGAAAYRPVSTTVEFSLGDEPEQVGVRVLLAMLQWPDDGRYEVTAQAIIRRR